MTTCQWCHSTDTAQQIHFCSCLYSIILNSCGNSGSGLLYTGYSGRNHEEVVQSGCLTVSDSASKLVLLPTNELVRADAPYSEEERLSCRNQKITLLQIKYFLIVNTSLKHLHLKIVQSDWATRLKTHKNLKCCAVVTVNYFYVFMFVPTIHCLQILCGKKLSSCFCSLTREYPSSQISATADLHTFCTKVVYVSVLDFLCIRSALLFMFYCLCSVMLGQTTLKLMHGFIIYKSNFVKFAVGQRKKLQWSNSSPSPGKSLTAVFVVIMVKAALQEKRDLH